MSGIHTGIVVGIPLCGRPVTPEWALSLAILNWPINFNVHYAVLKGQEVGAARNQIAQLALERKAKYLWFIDDDTAPPHFAAQKLIRVLEDDPAAMVAAGIYPNKLDIIEPMLFKKLGDGAYWHWKVGDVFDCEAIGTGCMMIRTAVFDRISPPWFQTVDEDCDNEACYEQHVISGKVTDDIYFCRKLVEARCKIMAHGGVLPVHWDVATGRAYTLPDDSYPFQKEVASVAAS